MEDLRHRNFVVLWGNSIIWLDIAVRRVWDVFSSNQASRPSAFSIFTGDKIYKSIDLPVCVCVVCGSFQLKKKLALFIIRLHFSLDLMELDFFFFHFSRAQPYFFLNLFIIIISSTLSNESNSINKSFMYIFFSSIRLHLIFRWSSSTSFKFWQIAINMVDQFFFSLWFILISNLYDNEGIFFYFVLFSSKLLYELA